MPKDLSPALLEVLQSTTPTLATGWRVIRADAQAFGWTDHDEDVTIDGVLYRASLGLTPTAAHTTQTLSVSTLDVSAFLDQSTEEEVIAGIWDNALVTVFEYDWVTPPTALGQDVLVLRHGNLGPITRQNNLFKAEIRGLTQRLGRSIGRAYSPSCPWRHAQWKPADSTYVAAVECGLDLATLIQTGTITDVDMVSPTLIFTDSANTQVDDYYAEGLITFTTGANTNVTREVRLFATQQWTLYRPFPFPVVVGDAYSAVVGDDKTFARCQALGRTVSFGGFPHIPGIAFVYQNPVHL